MRTTGIINGTFNVKYEVDEDTFDNERGTVTVEQHGPSHEPLVFRHFTRLPEGGAARITHTKFRDEGGELDQPYIYAASAQAACGEAMKIAVDRYIAFLIERGEDPFAA